MCSPEIAMIRRLVRPSGAIFRGIGNPSFLHETLPKSLKINWTKNLSPNLVSSCSSNGESVFPPADRFGIDGRSFNHR